MAARKKKTASRKKKSAAPPPSRFAGLLHALGEIRSHPGLRVAGWAIVLVGLGVLAAWGVPRLEQRVAAAEAVPPGLYEIRFVERPAWVRGELLARLDLTARRQLRTGDPLAADELDGIRRALLETSWFRDVAQVRRVEAGVIEVEATWVVPAAVVRDAAGDHLIDAEGVLLPLTFPHGEATVPMLITGVRAPRPPQSGRTWPGGAVHAGLQLVRLLDERPWRDQIAAIDVADYDDDGTLILDTDQGAHIRWGRPPGEEEPLEVPATDKLAYLQTAYQRFGRIDTGHRGHLRFSRRGYFAE